jgi:hypothetical protein
VFAKRFRRRDDALFGGERFDGRWLEENVNQKESYELLQGVSRLC